MKLTWAKGGEATIVALSGDAISLVSTVPSPPGSRIDGALADGSGTIRVKVHGSKKRDDGSFAIEGRAIDMTKEMREKIGARSGS